MYAKVFSQIFDSSIADDYQLRHFFMDLLVLADENGVVDMTMTAIAARTRMPLAEVQKRINQLCQPDPESRTADHEGRRICLLDGHRNWGWVILNYPKFRAVAKQQQRQATSRGAAERHRTKTQNAQLLDLQANNGDEKNTSAPYAYAPASDYDSVGDAKGGRFQKPTVATVKLQGAKIGVPEEECEKFYDYYEANGWRVGKNPMKLWTAALSNWKRNWQQFSGEARNKSNGSKPPTNLAGQEF